MKKSKAKKIVPKKTKNTAKKVISKNKSQKIVKKVMKPVKKEIKSYKEHIIPPIPEKPANYVPVPKKTLPVEVPVQRVVPKPAPAKKTPLVNDKDAEKLGTVESALFDSKMPMNCTVPICGQPAFRKDVDQRMWCEDHRDRGRWK
ncbi:MAG: hypothetical protein IPJ69_13220 [Deltaproteobacteria bacterium]|nr:MAG: hypothetical protein IPJ69_13220 [Deltaproteobacteria bacterium]